MTPISRGPGEHLAYAFIKLTSKSRSVSRISLLWAYKRPAFIENHSVTPSSSLKTGNQFLRLWP